MGAAMQCARNIPMTILPALVLLNGDLNGEAEFAFGDLDSVALARLRLAARAIVGRSV
jgi:hypothetical protein